MRRLLFVQLGLLGLGLGLALPAWKMNDRELWLAATAFSVAGVVMGAVLFIAALVERRVVFAVGGLVLGAVAFFTAYIELLIGVAMSDPAGRPLRAGGRRSRGGSWARGPSPAAPVDRAKWLADARAEHASVPAFARLAYQLWAHGAPPELIARCHEAALEEIEHARRCFAVAGEERAEALELPALEPGSLTQLAVESLNDGVYGEGRAAARAEAAAAVEADPVLRELYVLIARDERRHAELAADVVRWARGRFTA